ncbi:hypothetical protein [Streptomyces pinistramenti]|uniref:hypothetical protein n=1 Tax=Streptomyces pinistramenti TaxID=2884812 RepID=UPI001D087C08|nr:hypothetical protein [Streptomyces pinistramenti]MCB5908846.1 hypothetical protein [Streptomyces pinistramenti]
MLFSALLGDAVAWRTQQDGRLVGGVVPAPGMEHSLVSAGSHPELGRLTVAQEVIDATFWVHPPARR